MAELETRIAALELLFLEASAWASRQMLEDVAEGLRIGEETAGCEHERAIKQQALAIVEDALERRGD
jgi:hypothetical protein